MEIWQRNKTWSFKLKTTEKLVKVVLDPDQVYPDINPTNNIWQKN